MRSMKEEHGKPVQSEAEQEDDRRASQRVKHQRRSPSAFRLPPSERKRHRHADDEEKERKDRVRVGPAVPFRVEQRGKGVLPASGRVDDEHAGDRETAEDVQGNETGIWDL